MRATEFIIEGVAEGLEYADKLSGLVDLPVFTSSTNPKGTAKVVNTGDRIMVVMNVRGVNVPYYISTGGGGKASVPTGKWYPVFGRHSSGWLNKGGEDSINKFYGSKMLALNAGRLNNALGDLSSVEAQIPFMKKTGDAIINKDLQPMGHSEVSANPDEFKKRVNAFLAKLGSEPFYKVNTTQPQDVAEGATVTRIDSKPITDFGPSLKAYKHTDDWSQSGVDTGDDSYWKNKNLKTNTTKGLFAGDPKRTALYATGNAHETRYVEFTQNGQPIVYFDRKDLPAMRSRKTYLTVFDASDFRQLPTGEWFSENPSKPIKQVPIGDPFKYIASQGWIVRVTDNLDKVFKQVQNMHKAGKIAQYGAEGMNESKQGVAEGFPQPGPSSGAPQQFGSDAKIQTRQMTVKDIISSIPGVPYYNNVVDDWDAKDYSWNTTEKVIEYATYLKDHPESLAKLPPIIVLNGKFEDGAHRVSAIWLLQQRMDPKNPLWKNAKLNVQFVKQGVAEDN